MNERTTRFILKIRGEEEDRWILRERKYIRFILFYFNYFFVSFEKFSLILDARFFVAGE